jgi:hypothetical protein
MGCIKPLAERIKQKGYIPVLKPSLYRQWCKTVLYSGKTKAMVLLLPGGANVSATRRKVELLPCKKAKSSKKKEKKSKTCSKLDISKSLSSKKKKKDEDEEH